MPKNITAEKRAFVVLGSESSGTRLMTRLLISSGCEGGDGHDQPWDKKLPTTEQLIVWRRSVPHRGNSEPNIKYIIRQLGDRGYETTVIIMSRDWYPMAKSILINHPPETLTDAYENIHAAHSFIFATVGSLPFVVVNYEALVLHADNAIGALFNQLDLPGPADIHIYDGNEKHYATA